MDVIGVGGIDFEDNIARFSSRGMTTWVWFLCHVAPRVTTLTLHRICQCTDREAACDTDPHPQTGNKSCGLSCHEDQTGEAGESRATVRGVGHF